MPNLSAAPSPSAAATQARGCATIKRYAMRSDAGNIRATMTRAFLTIPIDPAFPTGRLGVSPVRVMMPGLPPSRFYWGAGMSTARGSLKAWSATIACCVTR
jgi:hypothetical protein